MQVSDLLLQPPLLLVQIHEVVLDEGLDIKELLVSGNRLTGHPSYWRKQRWVFMNFEGLLSLYWP